MAWQASSSCAGRQPGLEQHHLVQVGRLVHAGERGGLLDGGRGDEPGVRQRRQRRAGRGEVPGPVAEVAAERHVGALGGAGPRSGLDDEVPGDALQVGGDLAQLADRPLEVGLPARRLGRRGAASASVSVRVRAEPAATRSICPVRPVDRAELLGGRGGDAPGRAGLPRRWCRRWRRAPCAGVGAQLLDAGHRLPAPLHLVR